MGSDRTGQKPILGLREWTNNKTSVKKNKKDKKNEQSASQGSTEVRNIYQQGEADRGNQKIISNDFHYIPEPQF